jgi:outer membrane protein OmpA-like peptidoglycan-associated protein
MLRRYKSLFICLLIIVFNNSKLLAQGQVSEEDKAMANEFMRMAEEVLKVTKALDQARDMYIEAVNFDPTNVKANFLAGEYYLLAGVNKDRATKYFLKAYNLDPNHRFDLPYKVAQGYQYGFNLDSAIYFYEIYKNRLNTDKNYRGRDKIPLSEVDRRITECTNTKDYMANPAHYSIVNVGKEINSEWSDYGPVLNADETIMIFTSRRRDGNLNENVDIDNQPYEDIFISRKVNGKWSRAENIGEPVNTAFHGSTLALSADGKQLYIYKDDNNVGNIYVSELKSDGKTWTNPKPLSDAINSSFFEKDFAISPDNSFVFFSSNRPGGLGGFDIYVSRKDKKGNWTRAVNLGPSINTPEDDESPFIDYDGKSLYFSSRGRKGMGGHDIYRAEYDSIKKEWTEPVNLGYPINTPDDDVFFVSTKDGKRGYYASARTDGMGYLDIYLITIPELLVAENKEPEPKKLSEKVEIKEVVQNVVVEEKPQPKKEEFGNAPIKKVEDTTKPVILMLSVEDYDTDKLIDAKVSFRTVDDKVEMPLKRVSTGVYEIESRYQKQREFMLSIEKEGYMFRNMKISLPAASSNEQRIERKIELERLRKDFQTVLRNIYFDFDKATFTIDSYNELNKLEKLLSDNRGMVVEISGHTDNIGGKAYNKVLSQRRANAVMEYLTNKGIDRRRIKAVGLGQERPLASNDDEKDGRSLNRRVEFKILDVSAQ